MMDITTVRADQIKQGDEVLVKKDYKKVSVISNLDYCGQGLEFTFNDATTTKKWPSDYVVVRRDFSKDDERNPRSHAGYGEEK